MGADFFIDKQPVKKSDMTEMGMFTGKVLKFRPRYAKFADFLTHSLTLLKFSGFERCLG